MPLESCGGKWQSSLQARGFVPSHLSGYSFVVNKQLLATYTTWQHLHIPSLLCCDWARDGSQMLDMHDKAMVVVITHAAGCLTVDSSMAALPFLVLGIPRTVDVFLDSGPVDFDRTTIFH